MQKLDNWIKKYYALYESVLSIIGEVNALLIEIYLGGGRAYMCTTAYDDWKLNQRELKLLWVVLN